MTKRIYRILLLALLLIVTPEAAVAQFKQIYNDGVSLLKKGKCSEAKVKFVTAKKINPTKAADCDAMIAHCNECLNAGNKNSGDTSRKRNNSNRNSGKSYEYSGNYLEMAPLYLYFEGQPSKPQVVSVNTNTTNWTCNVEDEDAKQWCKLEKINNDGQQWIQVTCTTSERTLPRKTRIAVKNAGMVDHISVSQAAGTRAELIIDSYTKGDKDTYLTRSELKNPVIVVSKKKGQEQIVVNVVCKSDTIYKDGYNNNWTVMSMPDWCVRKNKKALYERGNNIKKIGKKLGIGKKSEAIYDVEHDELVFEVKPVTSAKLLQSGRIDNIVLRSQDQQCVIEVSQTE